MIQVIQLQYYHHLHHYQIKYHYLHKKKKNLFTEENFIKDAGSIEYKGNFEEYNVNIKNFSKNRIEQAIYIK